MEIPSTSRHNLLSKLIFGMGAEECVKLPSKHVSDLHLLNPQDPVLDLFFFLRCYRNIYTLVPSPSQGRLTPVDFEECKKHKPRQ